jgi:uncharacterized spore protein YtfJ
MPRFTPSDEPVADAVSDPENAEAVEAATRATEGDALATRLAERLGMIARASTVFGEAVSRDGITVIPVARARVGFGGGSGGDDEHGRGEGGGGGATVKPIGWIEITDSGSRYRPLTDRRPLFAALAGLAIAGGVTAAARMRIGRSSRLRRLKRAAVIRAVLSAR